MKNHYDKTNSMDGITHPKVSKNKPLNDRTFKTKSAEDVFSTNRKAGGSFESVAKTYTDPARTSSKKQDKYAGDLPLPAPTVKAKGLKKGVKFGKGYISIGKLLKRCVIALIILAVILSMFPPLFFTPVSKCGIDYEKNPFEKMGIAELHTYALSNYAVYNENAFSTHKRENYKVFRLVFELGNYSPFKLRIPQIKVLSVDSKYSNNICYSKFADENGEVPKAVEIPSFSSKDVTIEILMNVNGLSQDEIDEAITSMIVCTSGMKKIAGSIEVPAIPGIEWVSNNIEADTLDKE